MRRSLKIFSLFMVTFMIMVSLPVYGQNTRNQENKKARLEKEIALIGKQLRENESKSKNALSSLTLIRKQISNRQELVRESDRIIQNYNYQIKDKEQVIQVLQNRLDTLTIYYSKLVKSAYKNRDAKIWYLYILGSENTAQAFRRLGYFKNITRQMNTQAKKILETQEKLEKEKASLLKLKAEAQQLKAERVEAINQLNKEEALSQKLVAQLNRNKNKYQKDLRSKRQQVEALNREIARIIRAAAAPSGRSTAKSKVKIDYALDAEFAKNKGKLPWPADGPIVEAFGQRHHPVFKNVKLPFNNGISIALAPRTEIRTVFEGVVKQIVVVPGYNKCILVQHGNYFSFYCKMREVYVKAGDKVKTSEPIGIVDTIDNETQLHLQIWKGTQPDNPEFWLQP